MNDEQNSEEISDIAEELPKRGSSFVLVGLLALVSLLALGLSVQVYLQMNKIRKAPAEVPALAVQNASTLSSMTKSLALMQQEKTNLQQQLNAVEQQQQQLAASLALSADNKDAGKDDWQLAEIEYLLIIAIHRLQLESDVSMALAAMQAADDRLRDRADPRFLTLRRQIAKDMNAMKAVERVDISGLALFLSDLVGRVAELPLQQARLDTPVSNPAASVDGSASKWQQLKSSIWQELKDLVIISRRGEEQLATLMPEQQYFLYQNLRLQLESARYAVLRRDTASLRASLEIVTAWLHSYFDYRDNSVANILDSIAQMQNLDLNPHLPDISAAVEILRDLVNGREEGLFNIEEKPAELEQ
jgi:uroporphyrin-III C-methyltransferase